MLGINTTWITTNFSKILELTVDHVKLAVPAILGTLILAIPLGYLAHRLGQSHSRLAGTGRNGIIVFAGVLYGIPSLALFVILPLIMGTSILSPLNVIVALLLYGLALQTRVVAEAFDGRDRAAADAAEAIGYTAWEAFWKVDLPLAGPAILAGMRVVSASTLSLVSVGALIGVSSLGDLLTNGFLRTFPTQILTGVVAILILAIVFDLVILLIGRILMPWRKKAGLA